jgi:hypothetical protein
MPKANIPYATPLSASDEEKIPIAMAKEDAIPTVSTALTMSSSKAIASQTASASTTASKQKLATLIIAGYPFHTTFNCSYVKNGRTGSDPANFDWCSANISAI